MNQIKFLLLSVALLTFSCSKEEDAAPASSGDALSLAASQQAATAPTAMVNSSDPQAQTAVAWIATASAMTNYFSYFQAPANATKSNTAITASNGRVAAGSVTNYVWKDTNSGYTVGYQVTDGTDSYSFDIFLILPNETKWLKYIHAEETKDKSKGSMKIFDIFGVTNANPSTTWFTYAWTRVGDDFTLKFVDVEESFMIELKTNQKTKAGSVKYYQNTIIESEMTWDAKGNGTWKEYDEKGKLVEQGSWTV